jgi:hypothetical protein
VLVFGLYWRTLSTNFVYDDWLVLGEFHRSGAWATFLRHCNPAESLVYRPLAWLHFALLYKAFGVAPLPFHIVSLVLLSLNGALVAWIGTRLTRRKIAGVVMGAMYLVLSSLHLDTLLWMVGFYDIGATTFALLSVISLMRDRPATSAAFTMCALLTKEATAFLPVLLFLWVLLTKRSLRTLSYHAIVAALYSGVKLFGLSPFTILRDSPHAMEVSPKIIMMRGMEYLQWLLSSFVPQVKLNALPGLGFMIVLLIIVAWALARHGGSRRASSTDVWFLVVWVVLALSPVLLLRNQSARYYAVHAAIPAALLASIILLELQERVAPKRGIIGVFVLLAAVGTANALDVDRMFAQEMRQVIINDGYFHLIKRAAAVDAIRDSLMARPQPLKPGTVVVVSGFPLDAVGGSQALQIWFQDSTLTMRSGTRSDFQRSGQVADSVLWIDFEAASAPLPSQTPLSHE